ncbi:MAG: DUF4143 domain-containing protein [Rhodonellum sp.]|nr:DUF4143 domain-containing protein [Rhodonellum sp.]MDO9551290.1 DUF4143 domain-containing protein [Rhodonellum sp.]
MVMNIRLWFKNIGKRLVKSPKVFIRDSGLFHVLLNISNFDALLSHPVAAASWEGFVIENMFSCLPKEAYYWYIKTAAGAEIDLELEYKLEVFTLEIKRMLRPKLSKGLLIDCEDIVATQMFFV